MRSLIVAELRSAWSSWCAVLIAFVAASFSIVLALLAIGSVADTVATGLMPPEEVPALQFVPAWNLGLAIIGTLSVIGAVTALVVQARRGALARLALAGATPGQVSRILMAQLTLVAAAGAVLGTALAVAALPTALAALLGDRNVDGALAVVRPDLSLALGGAAGFVAVALLAGLRQSRVAAKIPPVEALRTVPGAAPRRRMIGRWVGAILLALLVVGIAVAAIVFASLLKGDGADMILQVSLLCILLTGSVFSVAAPLTIGALTRAWTALIPSRSAAWTIARAIVITKGERLARTVTPIMLTVGLLVGLGFIGASAVELMHSMGYEDVQGVTIVSLLVLIALALVISISGGVSVLLMMSRQREAELALSGVIGATPRQQALIPVLEGVIITVTATILGLAMTASGLVVFVVGLNEIGLPASVIMPWGLLVSVVLICGAVVVASTTLPVLPSLRRSARQVVAQLSAE
ncbi:MAG: hypothetical protein IPJ61_06400 [Tessaracoccus sp.]|uniref:FtsX-like permease family protein n=1 Tax=Tessaracoccus sp. TaxID=1971211 RepID=UPI001ED4B73B|nr:FtsX-like permease family protein [Tessaracoccus sp.]MBK7820701.1 hypothetical protein [Tessaracoccus sp.]